MLNFSILSSSQDPGLADGLLDWPAHLPTSAGFLLTLLFMSLSQEQGPPMHQQNTYVQRNDDAGKRMSCLAPSQRARQLSLLAPGGPLDSHLGSEMGAARVGRSLGVWQVPSRSQCTFICALS